MDFLLSWHGAIYNIPAFVVLAVLLYERPYLGAVLAFLSFYRIIGLVTGVTQAMGGVDILDASMHAALGAATMFAWSRGDEQGNVLLFFLGGLLLVFTFSTVGWLLADTVEVYAALMRGAALGAFLGLLRALFYGIFFLFSGEKKDPAPM